MPIIFHRLAVRDFVQARRWYAARSAKAETRFMSAVGAALETIEANPMIAGPYRCNYRWQRVKRFPYLIYFEPIAARIIHVYAIIHAREGRASGCDA
jgi:plasmid stabilization system protein ParE